MRKAVLIPLLSGVLLLEPWISHSSDLLQRYMQGNVQVKTDIESELDNLVVPVMNDSLDLGGWWTTYRKTCLEPLLSQDMPEEERRKRLEKGLKHAWICQLSVFYRMKDYQSASLVAGKSIKNGYRILQLDPRELRKGWDKTHFYTWISGGEGAGVSQALYAKLISARIFEKVGDRESARVLYSQLLLAFRYFRPHVEKARPVYPVLPHITAFEAYVKEKVDQLGYEDYYILLRFLDDAYSALEEENKMSEQKKLKPRSVGYGYTIRNPSERQVLKDEIQEIEKKLSERKEAKP